MQNEEVAEQSVHDNGREGKQSTKKTKGSGKIKRKINDRRSIEEISNIAREPSNEVGMAVFTEDGNDVVIEVTCNQESEFLSEDSDDYQEDIMNIKEAEFEDALAAAEENTNASALEDMEMVTEVPLEIRQMYEEGVANQKRQSLELEKSREEINALKALIAKFKEVLTKQNFMMRNQEFEQWQKSKDDAPQPKSSQGKPQKSSKGRECVTSVGSHLNGKSNGSLITVYQQAVQPASVSETDDPDPEIQFNFKRVSTSDEEGNEAIISSDEFMDENMQIEEVIVPDAPTPPMLSTNVNQIQFADRLYDRRPEPSSSMDVGEGPLRQRYFENKSN